jgi:hypothetical protein
MRERLRELRTAHGAWRQQVRPGTEYGRNSAPRRSAASVIRVVE